MHNVVSATICISDPEAVTIVPLFCLTTITKLDTELSHTLGHLANNDISYPISIPTNIILTLQTVQSYNTVMPSEIK